MELHAKKTFTVTSAKITHFIMTTDFLYDNILMLLQRQVSYF